MAKQTLPTNFKDDILSSSMGGKRKYRIIDNGDGTYSFEDVTDYTQTGSDFGAGQINATNQAVNESCDKANVIETMNDIMANQASGMIAGAKAVAELNGNINNGTKELWALHSPGWMMADGSTLTLPEPISKQKNGIILVWSRHDPDAGSSLNYGWNYSYIPKDSVAQGDSNNGHNFLLTGESLGYVASKYLYISDTQIVGSTNNAVNNVTDSGITTRNRNFALRQVLAY